MAVVRARRRAVSRPRSPARRRVVARALADALAGRARGPRRDRRRRGGRERRRRPRAAAPPRTRCSLGAPTEAVLERLRRRAAAPAWDAMVAGILLQRDAGGDLPALLRDLAAALEAAARQDREAVAATAQARFTARLVLGMPLAAAALLAELGSPGCVGRLIANPVSAWLTVLAALFQAVAIVCRPPHLACGDAMSGPAPVTAAAILAGLAAASATVALAELATLRPRRRRRRVLPSLVARLGARLGIDPPRGLAARIAAAGLDTPVGEVVAAAGGAGGRRRLSPRCRCCPPRPGGSGSRGARRARRRLPRARGALATASQTPTAGDRGRAARRARPPARGDRRRPGAAARAGRGRPPPSRPLAGELRRAAARGRLGEPVERALDQLEARCPAEGIPRCRRAAPRGAPRRPTSRHARRPGRRSTLTPRRAPFRAGRQRRAEDPARRRAAARPGRAAARGRGVDPRAVGADGTSPRAVGFLPLRPPAGSGETRERNRARRSLPTRLVQARLHATRPFRPTKNPRKLRLSSRAPSDHRTGRWDVRRDLCCRVGA